MKPIRKRPLCRVCRTITFETLSEPEGVIHADHGMFCDLCQVFATNHDLAYQKNFRLALESKEGSRYKSLGITFDSAKRSKAVSYHLLTDEGDPASSAGIRIRRKPETSGSARSYEIAKSWIRECISNHDCGMNFPPSAKIAPARLIDLHAFETESLDVRLVDTANLNGAFMYATLSYCWGNGMLEDSTTTTTNLSARQERLHPSCLPQTLYDAFTVTRGLDIRYLWIDALCIVQDNQDDWERESAKMSHIYGQSLVSISVETAKDCAEGFLSYRTEDDNPCVNHLIKLPAKLKDGRSTCLYVWDCDFCSCYISKTVRSLQETALSKRGWTYQERFLAPRILHYAGPQILWECRHCQGLPIEDGLTLGDTDPYHEIPPIFGPLAHNIMGISNDVAQLTLDQLRENWYSDVVPEFTRRSLGCASDKLPAISGIAKAFHRCLGPDSKYLAGLWIEDIAYALSWKSHMAVQRPPFYRAPTFSWACTDGAVSYQFAPRTNLSRRFVTLEDHGLEIASEDPFGRVASGWIRVTGFLGSGVVEYIKDKRFRCKSSNRNIGYPFFDDDNVMGHNIGLVVVYLPLYNVAPKWMFCLLLKKSGDVEGTYKRIGHVTSNKLDVKDLDEDWFAKHCVRTSLTIV